MQYVNFKIFRNYAGLFICFRAMFTDGLRECKESRVCLNGLTASSIAHLIDFAYNSTINLDSGKFQSHIK